MQAMQDMFYDAWDVVENLLHEVSPHSAEEWRMELVHPDKIHLAYKPHTTWAGLTSICGHGNEPEKTNVIIYINPQEKLDADEMWNTMVHEVMHIFANIGTGRNVGHRGLWAKLADAYNRKYPNKMPVKRCGKLVGTVQEIFELNPKVKYILYCPHCNKVVGVRQRKSKIVKDTMNGGNWHCSKCGEELEVHER